MKKYLTVIAALAFGIALLVFCDPARAQKKDNIDGTMEVGVARVDITPESPIRLAGVCRAVKAGIRRRYSPLVGESAGFWKRCAEAVCFYNG